MLTTGTCDLGNELNAAAVVCNNRQSHDWALDYNTYNTIYTHVHSLHCILDHQTEHLITIPTTPHTHTCFTVCTAS